MNYGLCCKGSKGKIAHDLFKIIPKGKRFVDLFGGGGAMSQYAVLSRRYEKVYYNEFNPLLAGLIQDGINGKYRDLSKMHFVTKDEFDKKKENDAFVRFIWSYGSDGMNYMFGAYRVQYARDVFDYIFHNKRIRGIKDKPTTISARYKYLINIANKELKERLKDKDIKRAFEKYKKEVNKNSSLISSEEAAEFGAWLKSTGIKAKEINEITGTQMSSHYLCTRADGQPEVPTVEQWEKLAKSPAIKNVPEWVLNLVYNRNADKKEKRRTNKNMEYLVWLDCCAAFRPYPRIGALNNFYKLPITVNVGSYEDYKYMDGDVVYCDPPYEGTTGYGETFDNKRFYEWAKAQPYDIYISSYPTPDAGLKLIWAKSKMVTFSIRNKKKKLECLYMNH